MRISDWSSDVCSSDVFEYLPDLPARHRGFGRGGRRRAAHQLLSVIIEDWDGAVLKSGPPSFVCPNTSQGLVDQYPRRSEEHTSELQSLMRNSYAVFRLKKKNNNNSIL